MPEGLSAAEVQALHDTQIARYGGSPGLRDCTALYAALIWLDLHNLHLAATQDELYGLTLEVAQGQLTLEDAAQFFETPAVERSE